MNLRSLSLLLLSLFLSLPVSAAVPTSPSLVTVSGRKILLQRRQADGTLSSAITFTINGLDWSPTPAGKSNAPDWAAYYAQDLSLMQSMNASVVRTYGPLPQNATGTAVLDYCYSHNIYVIMNVGYSNKDTTVAGIVNYFKKHPALLMFEVGNEWNYNFGYGAFGSTIANTAPTIQHLAGVIKANDTNHPVSSCLGHAADNTPFKDGVFTTCSSVDVWGFNTYVVSDASGPVASAAGYMTKPYYFSEVGCDAFNNSKKAEDDASQASYELQNWTTVKNKNQLTINGGTFSGEVFFEFSDEWWKASGAGTSTSTHDTGGAALGIYDGYANEEWWGFVDINRKPRQVYTSFQTAWAGLNAITVTNPVTPPPTGETPPPASTAVSFAQWKTTYAITNGAAVPYKDGVTNLMKYFADINPTKPMSAADRSALPAIDLANISGNTYFTLTYRRYKLIDPTVTVTVQTSSDLKSWTNDTTDQPRQTGTASTGDPIMQVQVPISGTRKFLRMVVTSP